MLDIITMTRAPRRDIDDITDVVQYSLLGIGGSVWALDAHGTNADGDIVVARIGIVTIDHDYSDGSDPYMGSSDEHDDVLAAVKAELGVDVAGSGVAYIF